MCGIAGYLNQTSQLEDGALLDRMLQSIAHRGPDDEGSTLIQMNDGQHLDLAGRDTTPELKRVLPSILDARFHHDVALGHRRYSIIDLSANGHQPMWNAARSVCLTFNGEIYNYVELREELQQLGHVFRTSSDTEVLLNGYFAWGEAVFGKLNGFFAVALYDAQKKVVLLARDRLGKAHLYFVRRSNGQVFWASEIKALMEAECFNRVQVDASAINDFLLFDRRDRSGTFWADVQDFPPGHFVVIDPEDGAWSPQRYWSLPTSRWDVTNLSAQEAADRLQDVLSDALRIRLRADVPIGFELSGGMDSSALVGLAAGRLGERLTTYTIKFSEEHANEEPYARAVAERYPGQIDYRVIQQPQEHFWSEANEFVWLQEEPFHAPNLHTNQHLRRCIKNDGAHIVIAGSAGDEMLAGYASDYFGPYLRYLLSQGKLKQFCSEIAHNTELSVGKGLLRLVLDGMLSDESRIRCGKWISGEMPLLAKVIAPQILASLPRRPSSLAEQSFHNRTVANMTYRRMNYWLRSGAKSNYGIPIEARAPFLDYRVVEYCCQLPPEYLISGGWHKSVLRMAVKDYLPESVVWRRQKMGFPFPYREWLLKSRKVARKNAEGVECPYIDTTAMFSNYDELVRVAPHALWRMLSVLLWWRRVIEQEVIFSE